MWLLAKGVSCVQFGVTYREQDQDSHNRCLISYQPGIFYLIKTGILIALIYDQAKKPWLGFTQILHRGCNGVVHLYENNRQEYHID